MKFSKKFRNVSALAFVLAAASAPALAAPTPTMPAVNFPLDIASIVASVGTAGAAMLGAWAGLWVAFRLIKKLIRGAASAV